MDKKSARIRRAKRTRVKIKELGAYRLSVHRSLKHIYAQLVKPNGSEVITSASTLDKEIKSKGAVGSNIAAAAVVGKLIAERAIAAGIKEVAFDRGGFKYHGRIKALAEAAREEGLQF